MKLSNEDWRLSMMISRRGRQQPDPPEARTLLVHRLSGSIKAIMRRGLRDPTTLGVFCEGCDEWLTQEFTRGWDKFTCPGCQRDFQAETVIYREINEL